jgi:hypothetical protein
MPGQLSVPQPLVRAWFNTVLNPLLQALQIEIRLLAEGNLTWRFEQRALASFASAKTYIAQLAWPNLEQFLSLFPEYRKLLDAHDQGVRTLLEACCAMETALVRSRAMQQHFQHLDAEVQHSGADIAEFFGACRRDDFTKVLAEYIINGVRRLPGYYSTAPIWNKHFEDFLAIRTSDEVRPNWTAVHSATAALRASSERLIESLDVTRNELSLREGVPIFESVYP